MEKESAWILGKNKKGHSPETVAFTLEQFPLHVFEDYTFNITTTPPRGEWVKLKGFS